MANAKTYNELNQASAVNASDLVAVAQADKTELQKTTVSDLANAVGELNQAGALAELSLATSIGKNLLAQRLNEKGVENITPNSTLVEMADAVDKLQTTESSQILKSKFMIDISRVKSKDTLGYTLFAWCKLPQGNTAVIASDTIYIFKTQGDYASLPDALTKAIMTVPLKNIPPANNPGRLYMTSSQDGKTLIVRGFSSGNTDIYDVNYETNKITYVKSLELVLHSFEYPAMAISNDRKLISIFSAWDHDYRIYNVDDITKYASVNVSTPTLGQAGFSTDNRTLYFNKDAYATGSYNYACTKVACTLADDGTVSANIVDKQTYDYGNTVVIFDKLNMLLIKATVTNIDNITTKGYAFPVANVDIYLSDLLQDTISFNKVTTTTAAVFYQSSLTTAMNELLSRVLGIIDIIKNADAYTIMLLYPNIHFTYDRNSKTISNIVGPKLFYINMDMDTYNQSGDYQTAVYYAEQNKNIFIAPVSEFISTSDNAWSGSYMYSIASISDYKVAGILWRINGFDTYYLRYNYPQADIKSGKFDLTTKQVEIPADN